MAKPVRVCFIHRDLVYYGGVPRLFLYYAKQRDNKRISLCIASLMPPTREMSLAFGGVGVPVHTLGDRGYILPTLSLRKLLRREAIDVVVATSLKSYIAAKVASAGIPTRVVFWLHGLSLMGGTKEGVYRELAKDDTLVFISHAVRRRYEYPGHRGRRFVVYNGVSDPYEEQEATPYPKYFRARYGIPPNSAVLGYIASFIGLKDHRTLLNAFAFLAEKYPQLHLVLVGTGPLLSEIRRNAEIMQAADRIHFLGAREDARRILGLLDIYVHPAVGEGFGLAVVEAMLAKRPVVVANSGALPEIVHHGYNGIQFIAKDARDLSRKISLLIENEHMRRALGARARTYSMEHFSPHSFAEQLTEIIEGEV